MKWLPWVGCAVLALILAGQCSVEPALREKLAANQRSLDVLTAQRDSLTRRLRGSVADADTVWTTHWLPARATVESLPVNVPVPYPVYLETVKAADTTINACRRVFPDCSAVVAVDSATIDTLRNRVKLLERQPPFRSWVYGASDLRGHLYAGAEATAKVPLLPVALYGRAETRLDSLALDLRAGVAIPF